MAEAARMSRLARAAVQVLIRGMGWMRGANLKAANPGCNEKKLGKSY
jgi:hypothetical protein